MFPPCAHGVKSRQTQVGWSVVVVVVVVVMMLVQRSQRGKVLDVVRGLDRRIVLHDGTHKRRHPHERGEDGRQVSRYETGWITPSLDALVRIAETFNVRVDYLVVTEANRRPLHSAENLLGDKLADLATLGADDRAAMLKVLDALVMKHGLEALTGGAGSPLAVPRDPAGSRPSFEDRTVAQRPFRCRTAHLAP